MLEAAEQIKIVINLIKQGKKVDLLKCEPELTPSILFGETQEQRQTSITNY